MAEEEQEQSQKTEDPTARKLEKGRERGQVAISQEVGHWGILLGGAAGVLFLAPWMMRQLTLTSKALIEQAGTLPTDGPYLNRLFAQVSWEMLIVLAPILGLLVTIALGLQLAQSGFIWAPERVEPDLHKLSPVRGLKRLFSLRSLVEFTKGIVKLTLVAAVAFGLALPVLSDLAIIPAKDVGVALDRTHLIAIRLAVGTIAVLTVIAGLDYAYQKYSFLRQMRMTKQELKDEHKQTEGDPMVRARIRRIRTERARRRMMAKVPKADVVITNPTHYAVALEYKMETMPAPRLVAKGVDSLAKRIREVAEENEVPIVENPPLAQALYATVDLDEEIPTEHYKAVAEVIGYVMRLKGKLP
jgi:flagellar biosynthetic protein FlhB